MINLIWFAMITAGIFTAAVDGNIEIVTRSAIDGAEQAVGIGIGLVGIIAFWSGMMQIAKDAGLIDQLARWMRPVARHLFPEIPGDHPAIGAILLSMSANLLGLGNAGTPLGIKAMKELQELDKTDVASNSMCTFAAITASSLTLVPSTIIAIRAAHGATNPADIIGLAMAATAASTVTAILFDRLLRRFRF